MNVHLATALAVLALMLGTWLLSVALRNASIVDMVWGGGFAVIAVVTQITVESNWRATLLTVLTVVWGMRLSAYLWWRNHGNGEDFRYVAMRKKAPNTFWFTSLITVFVLQGVLMWVISLPIQVGAGWPSSRSFGVIEALGCILWGIGLFFETVGDAQLARFKADPTSSGRVLDSGLWRYTRHPNYFGDSCVWWGIFLVAAPSGRGLWTVVSPLIMTLLLTRVSGVPLLEASLRKRRPGYEAYVARTSGFFPRPPRSQPAPDS